MTTDTQATTHSSFLRPTQKTSHLRGFLFEWLLIYLVAVLYCGNFLINFDVQELQQSGEHNESAVLPFLTEIGLSRYGQIPLWNPYMLTGFPHTGDFLSHFWNPVSTIPIMIWGAINGMKMSVFLTLIIAGLGQWFFAKTLGLRRIFRLWAAILFMVSGGLALLWRVGWYELLLGAAWFPWCFALYWKALQEQKLASAAIASLPIFMVISSGGGYYPIYLSVCLVTMTVTALLIAKSNSRWALVRSSVLVMLFSLALCAIVTVPYLDSFRYTKRDVNPDLNQVSSQPIHYALINYIINTPEWFRTSLLGTAGGWTWLYIGWLPIAALALIPWAISREHHKRWAFFVSGSLFLILILWFSNRYSPIKLIYDWIPFLYYLRFPIRLLIIATSPLLILSAQALEYSYRVSRSSVKDIFILRTSRKYKLKSFPAHYVVSLLWIVGLSVTTIEVYSVNKGFMFAHQTLDPKSFAVLKWLKGIDPSLYYVDIGSWKIYWSWAPAAYSLEMPVINFNYSRHLKSQDAQHADDSPFVAQAKYQILLPDISPAENAQLVREFDGLFLWYVPDTLPYAFSVEPALFQNYSKLDPQQVTALSASINGPNQVFVKGTPRQDNDVLVVLMSYYPGWKLLIDGEPANLVSFNGYLGAKMLSGEHSYLFYFLPMQFILGAAISVLTAAVIIAIILFPSIQPIILRIRKKFVPKYHTTVILNPPEDP